MTTPDVGDLSSVSQVEDKDLPSSPQDQAPFLSALSSCCETLKKTAFKNISWVYNNTCVGAVVNTFAFLFLLQKAGVLPVQIKIDKIEWVHIENISIMPVESLMGQVNKTVQVDGATVLKHTSTTSGSSLPNQVSSLPNQDRKIDNSTMFI